VADPPSDPRSDPTTDRTRLARAVARLDELVDWERRDRSGGMDRSLAPICDILTRLGDPHRSWRAVHVAGSKGKGSVCALVAAAMARAGRRVGVYASPHVERVNERVRIDGREVGDAALAAGLEAAWEARSQALHAGSAGRAATWFDLVTAAAFRVFARAEVEWAVVECGLGGRLDSTNVLASPFCAVTTVELEHTSVLGTSRAAIAREKGAILGPGGTLVTGASDPAALAVLEEIAAGRGGRLVVVPQAGGFEPRNLALAAALLEALGPPYGPELLDEDVRRAARLPARDERFALGGVPVVLDAAHVAESVAILMAELALDPRLRALPQVVCALGRDKDAAAILKALAGRADRVFGTSSRAGPLLSAGDLAEAARRAGLSAEAVEEPREALRRALERAAGGGWVLIIGSFYLAGELRPELATHPC